MRKGRLTAILFCLWLGGFFITGCSGFYVRSRGPERIVIGWSFLTDRHVGEIDVKTPEGGSFRLRGASSEQSKAVEALKATFELAKWVVPLL